MRGRLEFWFYVSVSVGMAVATSSFLALAGLFSSAGLFWVLVALMLSGLFCIVLSLSVAELASMYPSSPAIRTYFKVAFGNRVSLFFVYLYLIFLVLIGGVESYIFSLVVGEVTSQIPVWITIIGLLVAVMSTNLLGLELPRGLQMLTTTTAVLIMGTLGVLGLADSPRGAETALVEGAGSWAQLPALMGLAVFLYMGFEWVTPLGLRPASYHKRIPAAMPMAIVILMVVYVLFALGLGATARRVDIGDQITPQVPYFSSLLGRNGVYLAGVLSLAAVFSTFNAGIMGGSRLILVLSHEGTLPTWCGRMGSRTGAPVGAVMMLGVLVTASSLVIHALGLQLLAAVVGAATACVVYAGYMLAARRLRDTAPERRRPFRSPVPRPVQTSVIVVLLLLSLASLTSLPGEGLRPAFGMLGAGLAAAALSVWSLRRSNGTQRDGTTAAVASS